MPPQPVSRESPGVRVRRAYPHLIALSACTGLMFGLGAPPGGWWWLYWLAFAPLLIVARHPLTRSPWQAALYGLVGGLGIGLVGFPWIGTMLVKFVGVPVFVGWIGLFFFSVWLAVPYSLWGLLLYLGPQRGVLAYVWAPVTWVPLLLYWPVLFPYTPVLGLVQVPELAQLAEFGGSPLLEIMVMATALLVIGAWRQPFSKRRGVAAALAGTIPVMAFTHGIERMAQLERRTENAPRWRVGVVQPNVPVGDVPIEENFRRLRAPSAVAEADGAEVVIWPEAGTYPYRLPRPVPDEHELGRAGVLVGLRGPVLFGVGTRRRGENESYNSFAHMTREGRIEGSYDKVRLVPIGERIPIVDPDWARAQIPWISHLKHGEGPTVFELTRDDASVVRVGPLICLEDILIDYVREVAAQEGGVDVFVNATIDAWYGDSAEPWEHLALAQIRAIEHRVPIVRSVSTGTSAVIDHLGRLQAHIPPRPVDLDTLADWPPEQVVVDLALTRNTAEEPTWFARGGYALPWLCVATALAIGGVQRREMRSRLRPQAD
jgi:apolipoprotein N-acyltransferase